MVKCMIHHSKCSKLYLLHVKLWYKIAQGIKKTEHLPILHILDWFIVDILMSPITQSIYQYFKLITESLVTYLMHPDLGDWLTKGQQNYDVSHYNIYFYIHQVVLKASVQKWSLCHIRTEQSPDQTAHPQSDQELHHHSALT